MIVTVEELKKVEGLADRSDAELLVMAEGIEDFIRHYTNNNFTLRNTAYDTPVLDGKLEIVSPLIKAGDTILISKSDYNNGVYVLNDTEGELNKELLDCENNRVALVRYPAAVKLGVVKLLNYNATMDSKVGIASESLSRHSVSYAQTNGTDSVGGYPASMMTFLQPFMKARF